MNGQRVGYVRVSSFDQNPARQLEAVSVARTFTDKASGKDTRPGATHENGQQEETTYSHRSRQLSYDEPAR